MRWIVRNEAELPEPSLRGMGSKYDITLDSAAKNLKIGQAFEFFCEGSERMTAMASGMYNRLLCRKMNKDFRVRRKCGRLFLVRVS